MTYTAATLVFCLLCYTNFMLLRKLWSSDEKLNRAIAEIAKLDNALINVQVNHKLLCDEMIEFKNDLLIDVHAMKSKHKKTAANQDE